MLYHLSRDQLPPNTLLEPRFGRRGRDKDGYDALRSALAEHPLVVKSTLLAQLMHESDARIYLKEAVFELIREQDFPNRPSRLGEAIFAFNDLAMARRFQQKVGDRPLLYSVEAEGLPEHILDSEFATSTDILAPINDQLRELRERGHRYWNGEMTPGAIPEGLMTGVVRIKELVAS